jgi:hypothetical protein
MIEKIDFPASRRKRPPLSGGPESATSRLVIGGTDKFRRRLGAGSIDRRTQIFVLRRDKRLSFELVPAKGPRENY